MARANIIIPTYNRPNYLQRVLDYYHKYGKDFDIIVADSSSEENKKLNKEIILSLPNLNIQHLDKYPEEINPYYKFTDVVNYAKEKYCLFCADDDFVTPNGIKDSIDFLEKNPDFTVAYGYSITFWLKPKEGRKKQFFWEIRYLNQSITFSGPKVRLFKHLSGYCQPTTYGVHRTDFLKMVYKELLNSKVNPVVFGEMLPSMLTLIYGKSKCLDVLYTAREAGLHYLARRAGFYRGHESVSTRGFLNEGKYDNECEKFKEYLAVHLTRKSQIDIEKSKKLINKAMFIYMRLDYKHILMAKMKYILKSLHMPDWTYKKIRLLHRKLILLRQTDILSISLDSLPHKYYDDFEKIKNQVISYS